jgi:hypothetical protein
MYYVPVSFNSFFVTIDESDNDTYLLLKDLRVYYKELLTFGMPALFSCILNKYNVHSYNIKVQALLEYGYYIRKGLF